MNPLTSPPQPEVTASPLHAPPLSPPPTPHLTKTYKNLLKHRSNGDIEAGPSAEPDPGAETVPGPGADTTTVSGEDPGLATRPRVASQTAPPVSECANFYVGLSFFLCSLVPALYLYALLNSDDETDELYQKVDKFWR